jgi:hypothetical protein
MPLYDNLTPQANTLFSHCILLLMIGGEANLHSCYVEDQGPSKDTHISLAFSQQQDTN